MATIIQCKRGLAASWTQQNPILAEGEWGVELDTKKAKVGDGITAWNSLPYSASPKLSDLEGDSTHRVVTDAEKTTWNGKEDLAKALVSVTTSTASLQAGKRYNVTVAANGSCEISFDASTLATQASQTEIAVHIELGDGGTVTGGSNVTIAEPVVSSGWYRLVATNNGGTVSATLLPSAGSGDNIVTAIPSATTAYTMADNSHYTHTPDSQPTYTLPDVTNESITHKIIIDIDFTRTQYAEFVSAGESPVALDSISPNEGDVYRVKCRYIDGRWRIGTELVCKGATTMSNGRHAKIEGAVGGNAKSLVFTPPKTVVVNQHINTSDSSITLTDGHVWLTNIGGVSARVDGTGQSVSCTGGTDMAVDLTQYFNGDTNFVNGIGSWDELAALDSAYAEYVAYNAGTVKGAAPQIQIDGGTAVTAPEMFYIGTSAALIRDSYDAASGRFDHAAGVKDLGDLNWTYSSGLFTAVISDAKSGTSSASATMLCGKLTVANSVSSSSADWTAKIGASHTLYVRYSGTTDPTTFKGLVKGHRIIYQLDAATTETLTPQNLSIPVGDSVAVQTSGDLACQFSIVYECQQTDSDVITQDNITPKYVYGIDTDMTNLTTDVASKRVILNNAYDNDDYPAALKYMEQANGFGVLPVHNIRRLVSDDLATRHVNYWLYYANSNYKEDGVTPSVLTGEDGDVMAELPVGYMRVDKYTDGNGHPHKVTLISDRKFRDSKAYTLFRVGKGGKSVRPYWTGAFRSVHCTSAGVPKTHANTDPASFATGDKFRSIAGQQPAGNITRANFLQGHKNNGGTSLHFLLGGWLKILVAIEYGDWNEQSTFSEGFTNTKAFIYANMRKTGRTAVYGNGTGEIEADDLTSDGEDYDILTSSSGATNWNATATATHSHRIVQCSYRGIEDPFGSQWTLDDGIQKNQNAVDVSITYDGNVYMRDIEDDPVSINLYCWLNGTTKFYTTSATPAVGLNLYANTALSTVTGTVASAESDYSAITVGTKVYTRSSASDTSGGHSYAWKSGESVIYSHVVNPHTDANTREVFSDAQLTQKLGNVTSVVDDYTISGFYMTTDTDKFSLTHTAITPPSGGKGDFPYEGCSAPVWVHHEFPKNSAYIANYDPWTLFRLDSSWSGASNKGLADQSYNDVASGARLCLRGGPSSYGATAGLVCVNLNTGLASTNASYGSRLAA